MKKIVVVIYILFVHLTATASLIGKGGNLYSIEEKDFLSVIEDKVSNIDEERLKDKIQEDFKKEIKTFKLKDSAVGIPKAINNDVYMVDISFQINSEMASLITDPNGNPLYKEGTRINPLTMMREKGMSYPFILVIINANRKEEIDWFIENMNSDLNVKLLITDGYPLDLAEKLGRPVYQLTQLIKQRFQIKATPSYIWWPKNSDTLSVVVRAIPDEKDKEISEIQKKEQN